VGQGALRGAPFGSRRAGTVWTWNAIGKAPGAWSLAPGAGRGSPGLPAERAHQRRAPAGPDGARFSNSDPVTGRRRGTTCACASASRGGEAGRSRPTGRRCAPTRECRSSRGPRPIRRQASAMRRLLALAAAVAALAAARRRGRPRRLRKRRCLVGLATRSLRGLLLPRHRRGAAGVAEGALRAHRRRFFPFHLDFVRARAARGARERALRGRRCFGPGLPTFAWPHPAVVASAVPSWAP